MLTQNYLLEYYDAIKSGEIVTSKKVEQIYKRLAYEVDHPAQYVFDLKRANKPVDFIQTFCKNTKGEYGGQYLDLCLWEKAFLNSLFGFVDKDTGLRRFKQAILLVGRKNGKSTLSAGLSLYMLLAEQEPGPEIYSVATKLDQSGIIFNEVLSMVKQNKELRDLTYKKRDYLLCPYNSGRIQPLPRTSQTLDGLNASFCVIDEAHAIADLNLYEVLQQSMSSRREPLLLVTSTAGTLREGLYDNLYEYGKGIIEGRIDDDTILPVFYELDSQDEYLDEAAWIKANPSIGVIKKTRDLKDKVNKATQNPSDLSGLLTKDFNLPQTNERAFLSYEDIINPETFDINDFKGSYFIGGVDLSSVGDLTAATALMMKKDSDKKYAVQMFWLPSDVLRLHEETDNVPYQIWLDKGYLRVSEGNRVDYMDVVRWFYDLVKVTGINPYLICIDPWNGTFFRDQLVKTGFRVKDIRQGYKSLSVPTKYLESDIKARKLVYNNNPILKWNLCNVQIQTDVNGNIRPVKQNKSSKKRIDGVMSLINAYAGLLDNLEVFKQACN